MDKYQDSGWRTWNMEHSNKARGGTGWRCDNCTTRLMEYERIPNTSPGISERTAGMFVMLTPADYIQQLCVPSNIGIVRVIFGCIDVPKTIHVLVNESRVHGTDRLGGIPGGALFAVLICKRGLRCVDSLVYKYSNLISRGKILEELFEFCEPASSRAE